MSKSLSKWNHNLCTHRGRGVGAHTPIKYFIYSFLIDAIFTNRNVLRSKQAFFYLGVT